MLAWWLEWRNYLQFDCTLLGNHSDYTNYSAGYFLMNTVKGFETYRTCIVRTFGLPYTFGFVLLSVKVTRRSWALINPDYPSWESMHQIVIAIEVLSTYKNYTC